MLMQEHTLYSGTLVQGVIIILLGPGLVASTPEYLSHTLILVIQS